ncbi:MAG TPA: hypothetical protein V6D17_20890 [Candidatus Obscuribacterales bacterium]
MKRIAQTTKTMLIMAALLALTDALAAENQKEWKGYLIDRQCADSIRQDNNPKTFVMHHTKDCALMPNCRARGYALFADGKLYELDRKGNELAIQLLSSTKKERGFYVRVKAVSRGSLLKVKSMTESEESKPHEEADMEKSKHGTD